MARLVEIFFLFEFIFGIFGDFLIHIDVLIFSKFAHDFFYPPFHHPEVLFRIDGFGLGLCLYILYFLDGAVLALLTIETAIDTGSRLRWFIEHVGKMDLKMIIGELFVHKGHILRGVIDSEVMPSIGTESGEVESE